MASEIDLNEENVHTPGQWALEICKSLGYNHYFNPIGGKEIFDSKLYAANDIELSFLRSLPCQYRQFNENFATDLSILDVIAWNGTSERKDLIENYELVRA